MRALMGLIAKSGLRALIHFTKLCSCKETSNGTVSKPLTRAGGDFNSNEIGGVQTRTPPEVLQLFSYAAVLRFFGFAPAFLFLSRFAASSSATAFCSFSASTR